LLLLCILNLSLSLYQLLLGKAVFHLLQSGSDWRASSSSAGRVVVCRDAEGEDFAALLRVKKDGENTERNTVVMDCVVLC
jgi:hypothetical protein